MSFSVDKKRLVESLCRLAAHHCSYNKRPCDCKFISNEDESVADRSERGSGCPEITTAALLLSNMTQQEYLSLAERSGVTISDYEEEKINVFSIINDFQEKKMEKNMAAAKEMMTIAEQKRQERNYNRAKSPKVCKMPGTK